MKTGFIDVGGGTRGIYGAGVLDYCMEHGISCDYFIGVSAGAANGASFAAGQLGRNLIFYDNYAFRKKYMGLGNFIKDGSYIDLDYIFSTLSDPIPFRRAFEAGCDRVVVTLTKPKHFFRESEDDKKLVKLLKHHYPQAAEALKLRSEVYNQSLCDLLELELHGKAAIIAPSDIGNLKTLTLDHKQLENLYEMGRKDASVYWKSRM